MEVIRPSMTYNTDLRIRMHDICFTNFRLYFRLLIFRQILQHMMAPEVIGRSQTYCGIIKLIVVVGVTVINY